MSTPLRILLVEDDPIDAELVERELVRAGLLDVILCDFNLPRFNPILALDHLRQRAQKVPLLVVSGAIGEERAVGLLHRGASDVLLKDRLGRLGASA